MRVAILVLLAILCAPRDAAPYSVLAHEANIDALWNTSLRPLLARRFPRATPDEVTRARAYAYGGAVIQDLGYYPFGSHFFSNLVHYVRTGDFVQALIHESRDVNEYAFALGALAHYTADNVGHPVGVNRAVAMMYPKLRAEHGDSVTYADSPATHVLVEFSFDVVQAASGAYVSDMYRAFIGFEVAKPLLERAFLGTYGIEMKDVFLTEDLAFGSYRHAISETIPQITRIAWRDKREEIEKLNPGAAEERFIFNLSREEFEQAYGTEYQKPGLLARFFALPLQAAAKGRPAAAAAVQGAVEGGRGAVPGELQRHARALSHGARGAWARAPRFTEHRFRHRQAEQTRRIHAGRRDIRRVAAPAEREPFRRRPCPSSGRTSTRSTPARRAERPAARSGSAQPRSRRSSKR